MKLHEARNGWRAYFVVITVIISHHAVAECIGHENWYCKMCNLRSGAMGAGTSRDSARKKRDKNVREKNRWKVTRGARLINYILFVYFRFVFEISIYSMNIHVRIRLHWIKFLRFIKLEKHSELLYTLQPIHIRKRFGNFYNFIHLKYAQIVNQCRTLWIFKICFNP